VYNCTHFITIADYLHIGTLCQRMHCDGPCTGTEQKDHSLCYAKVADVINMVYKKWKL